MPGASVQRGPNRFAITLDPTCDIVVNAASRKERESGLDRAEPERALAVVGDEQQHPELAESDHENRQVGGTAVAVEHHTQRQEGA